nr:MAG TPA: hypothetical protein [Caudoviricetes sp.]
MLNFLVPLKTLKFQRLWGAGNKKITKSLYFNK